MTAAKLSLMPRMSAAVCCVTYCQ